jgi:hypothetical protein
LCIIKGKTEKLKGERGNVKGLFSKPLIHDYSLETPATPANAFPDLSIFSPFFFFTEGRPYLLLKMLWWAGLEDGAAVGSAAALNVEGCLWLCLLVYFGSIFAIHLSDDPYSAAPAPRHCVRPPSSPAPCGPTCSGQDDQDDHCGKSGSRQDDHCGKSGSRQDDHCGKSGEPPRPWSQTTCFPVTMAAALFALLFSACSSSTCTPGPSAPGLVDAGDGYAEGRWDSTGRWRATKTCRGTPWRGQGSTQCFDWKRGVNLGEASHPGPTTSGAKTAAGGGDQVPPLEEAGLGLKVREMYKYIRSQNQFHATNGCNGPINGELTEGSLEKVFRYLANHCGFGSTSTFLDIGAGRGKPSFHAAVFGVKASLGIECFAPRRWHSINLLANLLDQAGLLEKMGLNRPSVVLYFLHADVGAPSFKTLEGISHIYSFNEGMPIAVMKNIAKAFHRSKHQQYFICFTKPATMRGYGFNVEHVHQIGNLGMSGSNSKKTAHVYRKVASSDLRPLSQMPTSIKLLDQKPLPRPADTFYSGSSPTVPTKDNEYNKGFQLASHGIYDARFQRHIVNEQGYDRQTRVTRRRARNSILTEKRVSHPRRRRPRRPTSSSSSSAAKGASSSSKSTASAKHGAQKSSGGGGPKKSTASAKHGAQKSSGGGGPKKGSGGGSGSNSVQKQTRPRRKTSARSKPSAVVQQLQGEYKARFGSNPKGPQARNVTWLNKRIAEFDFKQIQKAGGGESKSQSDTQSRARADRGRAAAAPPRLRPEADGGIEQFKFSRAQVQLLKKWDADDLTEAKFWQMSKLQRQRHLAKLNDRSDPDVPFPLDAKNGAHMVLVRKGMERAGAPRLIRPAADSIEQFIFSGAQMKVLENWVDVESEADFWQMSRADRQAHLKELNDRSNPDPLFYFSAKNGAHMVLVRKGMERAGALLDQKAQNKKKSRAKGQSKSGRKPSAEADVSSSSSSSSNDNSSSSGAEESSDEEPSVSNKPRSPGAEESSDEESSDEESSDEESSDEEPSVSNEPRPPGRSPLRKKGRHRAAPAAAHRAAPAAAAAAASARKRKSATPPSKGPPKQLRRSTRGLATPNSKHFELNDKVTCLVTPAGGQLPTLSISGTFTALDEKAGTAIVTSAPKYDKNRHPIKGSGGQQYKIRLTNASLKKLSKHSYKDGAKYESDPNWNNPDLTGSHFQGGLSTNHRKRKRAISDKRVKRWTEIGEKVKQLVDKQNEHAAAELLAENTEFVDLVLKQMQHHFWLETTGLMRDVVNRLHRAARLLSLQRSESRTISGPCERPRLERGQTKTVPVNAPSIQRKQRGRSWLAYIMSLGELLGPTVAKRVKEAGVKLPLGVSADKKKAKKSKRVSDDVLQAMSSLCSTVGTMCHTLTKLNAAANLHIVRDVNKKARKENTLSASEHIRERLEAPVLAPLVGFLTGLLRPSTPAAMARTEKAIGTTLEIISAALTNRPSFLHQQVSETLNYGGTSGAAIRKLHDDWGLSTSSPTDHRLSALVDLSDQQAVGICDGSDNFWNVAAICDGSDNFGTQGGNGRYLNGVVTWKRVIPLEHLWENRTLEAETPETPEATIKEWADAYSAKEKSLKYSQLQDPSCFAASPEADQLHRISVCLFSKAVNQLADIIRSADRTPTKRLQEQVQANKEKRRTRRKMQLRTHLTKITSDGLGIKISVERTRGVGPDGKKAPWHAFKHSNLYKLVADLGCRSWWDHLVGNVGFACEVYNKNNLCDLNVRDSTINAEIEKAVAPSVPWTRFQICDGAPYRIIQRMMRVLRAKIEAGKLRMHSTFAGPAVRMSSEEGSSEGVLGSGSGDDGNGHVNIVTSSSDFTSSDGEILVHNFGSSDESTGSDDSSQEVDAVLHQDSGASKKDAADAGSTGASETAEPPPAGTSSTGNAATAPPGVGPRDLIGAVAAAKDRELAQALFTTVHVVGMLHVWFDSVDRFFATCAGTLGPLANEYRTTKGQMKWFMNCGNYNRCYQEAASLCAGMDLWFQFVYSGVVGRELQDWFPAYDFDEWRDTFVKDSTARRELQNCIEMFMDVKNIRDAIRTGSIGQMRLAVERVSEVAHATGGDNYSRILRSFIVQLETCSDRTFCLLPGALFSDTGSCFRANDEMTEMINSLLRRCNPKFFNATQWAESCAKAAATLRHRFPSFGMAFGVGGTRFGGTKDIGHIRIYPRISRIVFDYLCVSGLDSDETFSDLSGNSHEVKDRAEGSDNATVGGIAMAIKDHRVNGRAIQEELTATEFMNVSSKLVHRLTQPRLTRLSATVRAVQDEEDLEQKRTEANDVSALTNKKLQWKKPMLVSQVDAILEVVDDPEHELYQDMPAEFKTLTNLRKSDPDKKKYFPSNRSKATTRVWVDCLVLLKAIAHMPFVRRVLAAKSALTKSNVVKLRNRLVAEGHGEFDRKKRAREAVKERIAHLTIGVLPLVPPSERLSDAEILNQCVRDAQRLEKTSGKNFELVDPNTVEGNRLEKLIAPKVGKDYARVVTTRDMRRLQYCLDMAGDLQRAERTGQDRKLTMKRIRKKIKTRTLQLVHARRRRRKKCRKDYEAQKLAAEALSGAARTKALEALASKYFWLSHPDAPIPVEAPKESLKQALAAGAKKIAHKANVEAGLAALDAASAGEKRGNDFLEV